MPQSINVFGDIQSGKCCKVKLLLSLVDIRHVGIHVDVAYTHVADECGCDLSSYPAIGDWLNRIAAQPGHATLADFGTAC